ncbi:hypothetical protein D3C59_35710 [Streptomyces sp. SHP22-7]|nr:hypothetical protein D3C59_35710 [Streptomyces sp. SHP22-7]
MAVLRGSAVNQDGASNASPRPTAPRRNASSGRPSPTPGARRPDRPVEAHGTGRHWGPDRGAGAPRHVRPGAVAERPLWLGSLKSNIGHAQAAAVSPVSSRW